MTSLSTIIFWIIVVVFAITSVLLSYSLIRFQRKSTNEAKTNQQFQDNPVLAIIWTLVPVGILVVLLVLTFQTISGANQ
jgi:heme/copper-type cytochrome/quinol oxidase subunit 2